MEEAKPKKLHSLDSREEDRISLLPEEILHRILCSLSQKEAIKTCVLSKAWRYLGRTRPKIDFSLISWRVALDSALEPILQACHDRNLRLDEFAVRFSSALLLQKWIPTIIQNMWVKSFRLINVRTNKNDRTQYFRLPSLIIESHHIQNLSLHGCKFQSLSSTTITHEVLVYLQRLQTLWLSKVNIPEEILDNILSNCPFLEDVYLKDCKGFTRIKLFVNNNKPTKLARFYFKGNRTRREVSIEIGDDDLQTLTKVEIECCLLSFSHNKQLEFAHHRGLRLTGMELLSDSFPCNFTILFLSDVCIPEEILDSILLDCPSLRRVCLLHCKGFKRIKLSNNKNKPTNLEHFCFHGRHHPHQRDVSIEIGDHMQTLRSIEIRRCLFYVSHDKPLEFARLTRLILDCHVQLMSSDSSFSCNLHSLEELKLDRRSGIKEFKLSSRSMKHLSINNRFQTPFKATIDAPSMVSFRHEGILPESISFARPKTSNSKDLWESYIKLESSTFDHHPSHCFNGLYGLLKALSQSEISLKLDQIEIRRLWGQLPAGDSPLEGITNDYIVGFTERKQLPVVVEHLTIMWPEKNMHPSAAPFLNMLFHMFRPSFIYIGRDMLTNPKSQHREIAELLLKEKETTLSCIWQHVLEGASLQVLYQNQSECEWQPVEHTSLTEICKKGADQELLLRIQLKWRD